MKSLLVVIITLSLFVNLVSMDIYEDGADVMQGTKRKVKNILPIQNDKQWIWIK